jgi:hypothetical protein
VDKFVYDECTVVQQSVFSHFSLNSLNVGESHDAIRAFGLYIKHFECIGWTQPMEVSFAAHPPNMYFPGMDGDLPWTHDLFVKSVAVLAYQA